MKAAAALSVTGILALILAEALKILLAPVLIWGFGILLVVMKVLLVIGLVAILLSAIAGTVFVVRRVRGRREASI